MNSDISRKVAVVPYDIDWPNLFKDEANRIQETIGIGLKEIYHIGSAAIPNMPAKPAIDIMLVLDSEGTDYFTQKNSLFSWWISPHDQPADLSAHLESHGYKNTENNCAMYFDLDAWNECISPMSELKIIRATDEKTLHDFALVLTNNEAAFKTYFSWVASVLTEDDPIEYYVGYVDGKPVVRGLSCYFGQVAGLHWLSTVPSQRRKGYGRAMQEYRLKRAKELGYHVAVLQASNEGYLLYQQLGYKECGYFREYKKLK